jgi:hypothetical protein
MAAMQTDRAADREVLASFAGTFEFAARFTFYPDAPPIVQEGLCTFTPSFDGAWMIGRMSSGGGETSVVLLGLGDEPGEVMMSVLGPVGAIAGDGRIEPLSNGVARLAFEMEMTDPLDTTKRIHFPRHLDIMSKDDILGIDYRDDLPGGRTPFTFLQFIRRDTTVPPRQEQ